MTIGKIDRPFGVKGEVKVRSLSDVPGRFESLESVQVTDVGGQRVSRTVAQVRRTGSTYIVQFQGINTPEEAGTLRGALIQAPHCEAYFRRDDVWYECDLIGMAVVNEAGRDLGVVDTIWDLPGHQVLVVKQEDREVLIPAAKEFVKTVDLALKRMTVHTIEGMVEA